MPHSIDRIPDPDERENTPEKKPNPNSIGEVLSVGRDLPTLPDKVYRSVSGREGIDDLNASGAVRNAFSAGVVEKSRWGEKVFWSKGAEGKYHVVQKGGFVIEAPLSVAQERAVGKSDVTAIYTKNVDGKVVDVLQEAQEKEIQATHAIIAEQELMDEAKIDEVKRRLSELK